MNRYKRRTKKSRVSLLLATLLAFVLIGAAIVQGKGISIEQLTSASTFSNSSTIFEEPSSAHNIVQTLTALQQWSGELIEVEQTGLIWTMRWDLNLDAHKMEEMAQQLFIDEYNTALNKVITQNGAHISGAIPQHNGKLVLQKVENEAGEQKVVAILQLEHKAKQEKKLKSYVEYAHEVMQQYAYEVSFSAKVTGTMKSDSLKRIHQVTHSTSVEEYKDDAMKVVTAYSTKLKKSYWLGHNKMVNLQYAVYVDENTEDSILTLAIPLISGEFGEIVSN